MLSIIIVNYKTPELLRDCVASLKETIKKTGYEVIVVDVASDGSTAEALASLAEDDINLIELKKNTGYSKAVNAGLRAARGEYYLILNADMEALTDSVDKLVEFTRDEASQKNIGLIGPRLLGLDEKIQQSAFRFYTPLTIVLRRTFLGKLPWWRGHIDYFLMKDKNITTADAPQPVDWLMGTAILTTKEAVKKVGLMDERFFMYFEDVDWARRFWENGYKVFYYPKAVMRHRHGKASRKDGLAGIFSNKMTRAHIKSGFLYLLKYHFRTRTYLNKNSEPRS